MLADSFLRHLMLLKRNVETRATTVKLSAPRVMDLHLNIEIYSDGKRNCAARQCNIYWPHNLNKHWLRLFKYYYRVLCDKYKKLGAEADLAIANGGKQRLIDFGGAEAGRMVLLRYRYYCDQYRDQYWVSAHGRI